MLPKLPQPVVDYLAAVKAKDPEMFALCFTGDALVHDEGRDHKGLDAITAWMKDTQSKYKYVIEPLDASVSGNTVKLRARLTGDFPGSPADLDFTFMLANDKIASLEIG
jgi:ketosteroid isomerase-like protein